MSTAPTRLPGFDTPAVGFEQPFEMLEACHERVQRSLDLLQRLAAHIDARGHGADTRAAAADVLRYFDLAAPLHHEDEEAHVFPSLLAHGDATLAATVRTLQREHREMAATWAALRPLLLSWTKAGIDATGEAPADAATHAAIARFVALHAEHLATEERLAFPAVRAGLDAAQLAQMGRAMQARRQR